MKKKILLMFILGLNMHVLDASADAQPTIGMVVSVEGKVTAIDSAKQERPLQRRAAIYLQDRILTQKDSKAQLKLNDDSVIVVQPSSEFYVSEFAFNKGSPNDSKYVGNIAKGMLINISGQGNTKNYQLNSPVATIAFRGTSLATKLITSRNAIVTDQEIHVFHGYVTVNNRCQNVFGCIPHQINIGAGQQINSATVNKLGEIRKLETSGLLSECSTKNLRASGGGIAIRCKGS